jgi:hypothetical protein
VGFLKASEDKKGERERERGIGELEAIDPLLIYLLLPLMARGGAEVTWPVKHFVILRWCLRPIFFRRSNMKSRSAISSIDEEIMTGVDNQKGSQIDSTTIGNK